MRRRQHVQRLWLREGALIDQRQQILCRVRAGVVTGESWTETAREHDPELRAVEEELLRIRSRLIRWHER